MLFIWHLLDIDKAMTMWRSRGTKVPHARKRLTYLTVIYGIYYIF